MERQNGGIDYRLIGQLGEQRLKTYTGQFRSLYEEAIRPTIYVNHEDAYEGLSTDGKQFELIAAFGDENCTVCNKGFDRWDDNWMSTEPHGSRKIYRDHHASCVDIILVGRQSNG